MELRKKTASDKQDAYVAELDHTIELGFQAFRDAKDSSLNRSAYLSMISTAIERKAKLDGTLTTKQETTHKFDPATYATTLEKAVAEAIGSEVTDPAAIERITRRLFAALAGIGTDSGTQGDEEEDSQESS
jgi:hypothetical protein